MPRVFAIALLLGVAGFVQSADDKKVDKKEIEALEGTWIPESAEMAGAKFPDETRKAMKLVLKGDAYALNIGPKDLRMPLFGNHRQEALCSPWRISTLGIKESVD